MDAIPVQSTDLVSLKFIWWAIWHKSRAPLDQMRLGDVDLTALLESIPDGDVTDGGLCRAPLLAASDNRNSLDDNETGKLFY